MENQETTAPENAGADNTTETSIENKNTDTGAATDAQTDAGAADPANTEENQETKGLVFPSADNADDVLNFRKACGYPDDAAGYGLPMETDEQKEVLSFIHRCQLDPIAAKVIVTELEAQIAEQAKLAKTNYDTEYNKVVEAWGESRKANENLVAKGLSLTKISPEQLIGISENIGVEAALGLLMHAGRSVTDHSGVAGGSGGTGSESLGDFIAAKRAR